MKYPYYIADVFTQQMFNGAQIVVFPQADGLNTEKMALIARELNLSESVFINLDMDNKREEALTVRIGGHAVLVAEGAFEC